MHEPSASNGRENPHKIGSDAKSLAQRLFISIVVTVYLDSADSLKHKYKTSPAGFEPAHLSIIDF